MKLSEEDGKRFYRCWLPLLDYVNEKRRVNTHLRNIKSAKSLNPEQIREVANALWSEVSLIDEYMDENKDIRGEDRELILGWKRCVSGRFILERILKTGAVLISADNEEVYRVSGIISTWEEMFGYVRLPLIIDATLIPYGSVIIPDGLLQTYNVIIGGNMTRAFKDTYMSAKKTGRVHSRL